jgi:mono/diheme cytochrome c family protein
MRKIMRSIARMFLHPAVAITILTLGPQTAAEQADGGTFADPNRFMQQDGEVIYRTVCQGCHMPAGQGAAGAATYPALADNQNLAVAGYAVSVVAYGLKAMPPFASKMAPSGCLLNDAQIASVVNYVRTHFGNTYTDSVSADTVKSAC